MDALMTFWLSLIGLIIGLIIGLTLTYRSAVVPLRKKLESLSREKPSIDGYPFSTDNFRFIGDPIDGIQFEDDRIIFVEFKAEQSKSHPIKSKIKKLVETCKVEWFEFVTK